MSRRRWLALRLGLTLWVLATMQTPAAVLQAQALPAPLNLPFLARGLPSLMGEPWQILSHRLAPNLKGLMVQLSTKQGLQIELYRSRDGGLSWSATPAAPWSTYSTDARDRFFARLLKIGGAMTWVVVEAGYGPPRLWVLAEGDAHWTERAFPSAPPCSIVYPQTLMSTASAPDRLWVQLTCNNAQWSDDGVWWSDDGGAHWQVLHGWENGPTDWYGAPIGSDTEAGLLFRFGTAWMRSEDRGAHWTRASIPGSLLFVSPNTAQILISRQFGVLDLNFSSADGGDTWRNWSALPCPSGGLWQDRPVFPRGEPDTFLMVCGSGELARSSDLGQTWSVLTTPTGPPAWVAADDAAPNQLYASIQDPAFTWPAYRLWVSSDGGTTWQDRVSFQTFGP